MQIVIDGIEYELVKKQPDQRKPLFRTEDGKYIFEGDEYWHIVSDGTAQMENAVEAGRKQYETRSIKTFSTKEATEAYVKSQQPIHHGEDGLEYISAKPETGYPTIDRQEQKGRDWEIIDPYLADNKEIIIRSVRRLSDGQIFSVGDEIVVTYEGGKRLSGLHKIMGFKIIADLIVLHTAGDSSLHEIHKQPSPLSTTGVPLHSTDIPMYTKSEYEEAIRKAFEAARWMDNEKFNLTIEANSGKTYIHIPYSHSTLKSYLSTIKNK